MRTDSGLILPGNGHHSASERRIAVLTQQLSMQTQRADHVTAMFAVAIVQAGGTLIVPVADLKVVYDINAKTNETEDALVWTATKRPLVVP